MTISNNNILFLYTEPAEYFIACCKALALKGYQIHVVKMPVNNEAPFVFDNISGIYFYERENFNFNKLYDLYKKINPTLVMVSGWQDKLYLKLCGAIRKSIPVVLGFDTAWRSSVKQRMATILSPFFLLNKFTHCFVTGVKQMEYAQKLGFDNKVIYTDAYSCDTDKFEKLYNNHIAEKEKRFPHKFIFVGRYYSFKGITDLWQAFIELQNETPNDWELWCLGTGDIEPLFHPKIKHFGFIQPKDMEHYIANTGVFILPSRYEPWGVVAHEFAASGFPLLLSKNVGAAQKFLQNCINGYLFESSNVQEIKEKLKKIISMPDDELLKMGKKSNILSKQITPDKWADTLIHIMKNVRN